jgi:hypothetical protein
MKYFIDTEFIEYPSTIHLISVGIVAEDGRELYYINQDCDFSKASDWVKENVLSKLPPYSGFLEYSSWVPKNYIKEKIIEFIGDDKKPEFWGYYADYDWVVFCWIFGTMMDLPKGWKKYCNDIKQLCVSRGNPHLPEIDIMLEHNALNDARHNKVMFDFLMKS